LGQFISNSIWDAKIFLDLYSTHLLSSQVESDWPVGSFKKLVLLAMTNEVILIFKYVNVYFKTLMLMIDEHILCRLIEATSDIKRR
jgi:hypothetical protein